MRAGWFFICAPMSLSRRSSQGSVCTHKKKRKQKEIEEEEEKEKKEKTLHLSPSPSRKIYTDRLDSSWEFPYYAPGWSAFQTPRKTLFFFSFSFLFSVCCCSSSFWVHDADSADIYHTCYFVSFFFPMFLPLLSRCPFWRRKITDPRKKREKNNATTFAAWLNTCQRWLTLPLHLVVRLQCRTATHIPPRNNEPKKREL